MTFKKQIDGYTTKTSEGLAWVYRRENQRGENRWFARFAEDKENRYGWGDTRQDAVQELLID